MLQVPPLVAESAVDVYWFPVVVDLPPGHLPGVGAQLGRQILQELREGRTTARPLGLPGSSTGVPMVIKVLSILTMFANILL